MDHRRPIIKTTLILLIIITTLASVVFCLQNPSKSSEHITKTKVCDNINISYLKSLDMIIQDTLIISDKLIFTYTNFDCSSCVESGNEMSNQYKRAFGKNLCVIVVSRDENNIGLEFAKDILYYEDKNDFLRTELKFSHTPKILLLDKNNNILYCFDVTIDKDKMEEHYHNLTELISKRN